MSQSFQEEVAPIEKSNSIENEVEYLISLEREGEYWDFKEKHYSNKSDLLFDIICMANTLSDRDAYIIIGVTDNYELKGVTGDPSRKNQQNLIDFMKNKPFAGEVRPIVELHTVTVNQSELDVIVVKNSYDVPFYLSSRFMQVNANYIYTRVGDTNTPIDQGADIKNVEDLWKKRFRLNQSPLEQFKYKLQEKDHWVERPGDDFWYHRYTPEYTIEIDMNWEADRTEFYSYLMPNQTTMWGSVSLKYHGTTLYSSGAVILDGGRFKTSVPDWGNIEDSNNCGDSLLYKYFIKGDLNHLLYHFFNDNHLEYEMAQQQFKQVVMFFEDSHDKEVFEEYISNRIQSTMNEVKQRIANSNWLSRIEEGFAEKIATGKILKSLYDSD
ncbi:ATP-binding protein [Alkalibacillus salilacus]|uniref:Schlafen AlbA-2 domain-containing protein n=1 Tax=Alkalibacillus salilacus TaxID=284582 RepID=A0ABT9VIE5_9BACI|nr:ATP-binding protein [Alkalibacillus salilacus]MDQ0160748.1 hypothetical protein [Alkalibacillus salilacus]